MYLNSIEIISSNINQQSIQNGAIVLPKNSKIKFKLNNHHNVPTDVVLYASGNPMGVWRVQANSYTFVDNIDGYPIIIGKDINIKAIFRPSLYEETIRMCQNYHDTVTPYHMFHRICALDSDRYDQYVDQTLTTKSSNTQYFKPYTNDEINTKLINESVIVLKIF